MKTFTEYVAQVVQDQKPLQPKALSAAKATEFPDIYVVLPEDPFPGSKISMDVWVWPEYLMRSFTPSQRTIDFRLPHDLRSFGGDGLLATIKWLVVLMMVHPLGQPVKLGSLRRAQRMLNEFAFSILATKRHTSFGSLDAHTYSRIFHGSAKGRKGYAQSLKHYLNALRGYGKKGLIMDYPGAYPEEVAPSDENGSPTESKHPNEEDDYNGDDTDEHDDDPKTWIPLPDAYVAEMGKRCHFYLNELGPNLARLFSDHPDMLVNQRAWMPRGRRGAPTEATVDSARIEAWRSFLSQFEWRHCDGRPMVEVPFECEHLVFPPTKYVELLRLVGRHMDAAVQIVLLLSGGRKSEVQSHSRNVVDRPPTGNSEDDGFAMIEGRTFKPSPSAAGTTRNWPIPREVVGWLANQKVLAEQLGPKDGRTLWFSMSTTHPGVERIDLYYRCTIFPERHGLTHLTLGPAHPHRYRKTIARLALLALTGAPTLIMHMFGHEDLATTTLSYLLADPSVRDDLRTMLGEHRIDIGMNIMADLDQSSGPAADVFRNARDRYFDELHVPQNERSQRIRLLQFVTAKLVQGGYDIKMVYPGIVCIRALEQKGLCTTPGREINPSSCQSNCKHRLELSLRRDEVCAIIEDLLDDYYESIDDGTAKQDLIRSWMRSQLIDNVGIFPDIQKDYLSDWRYVGAVSEKQQ